MQYINNFKSFLVSVFWRWVELSLQDNTAQYDKYDDMFSNDYNPQYLGSAGEIVESFLD